MRALLLLTAACGRIDFATVVDDGGGADGARPSNVCEVRQLSTTSYVTDATVAVTRTPTGAVVFSANRNVDNIYVQRLSSTWDPIESPWSIPGAPAALTATYTDRLLLALQDKGATSTTIGVIQFPGTGVSLTGAAGAPTPPGEPGFLRDGTGAGAYLVSPAASGFEVYELNNDGGKTGNSTGGGTGDLSSSCAAADDGTLGTALCDKATTQGLCVLLHYDMRDDSYGMAPQVGACPFPSVAHPPGVGVAVFDEPSSSQGLRIGTWDNSATFPTMTSVSLVDTGRRAAIASDNRGIAVAFRDGTSVGTLRYALAPAMVTQLQDLPGITNPVGMAVLADGDQSVALVATPSGLYRACF